MSPKTIRLQSEKGVVILYHGAFFRVRLVGEMFEGRDTNKLKPLNHSFRWVALFRAPKFGLSLYPEAPVETAIQFWG